MILDNAGNAIASFDDEMTARATIHAIVRIEPEAADERLKRTTTTVCQSATVGLSSTSRRP